MWGSSIVGFGDAHCPGSSGRVSHAPCSFRRARRTSASTCSTASTRTARAAPCSGCTPAARAASTCRPGRRGRQGAGPHPATSVKNVTDVPGGVAARSGGRDLRLLLFGAHACPDQGVPGGGRRRRAGPGAASVSTQAPAAAPQRSLPRPVAELRGAGQGPRRPPDPRREDRPAHERRAGVPRLGIPAYNWWNEALHGVARAGTATVFPRRSAWRRRSTPR